MKKIEDYLHLYVPFEIDFSGYKYTAIGFKDEGHFLHIWHEHGFFDVLKTDFKIKLRSLSDMTEEEATEHLNMNFMQTQSMVTDVYEVQAA